jgi:hypothetical protein
MKHLKQQVTVVADAVDVAAVAPVEQPVLILEVAVNNLF